MAPSSAVWDCRECVFWSARFDSEDCAVCSTGVISRMSRLLSSLSLATSSVWGPGPAQGHHQNLLGRWGGSGCGRHFRLMWFDCAYRSLLLYQYNSFPGTTSESVPWSCCLGTHRFFAKKVIFLLFKNEECLWITHWNFVRSSKWPDWHKGKYNLWVDLLLEVA